MLPAPLMVSERGSFAEHTILKRKPQIIANIISTNLYPERVERELREFEAEIASGVVAPLTESAPDVAGWLEAWGQRQGKRWLELDWYFAEAYFYRRVLEIVRYFQPGPWRGIDPFEPQKAKALCEGLEALADFFGALPPDSSWQQRLSLWLGSSLWGNRVDLSNITIAVAEHTGLNHHAQELLLIDDRPQIEALLSRGVRRIDWIADNSGPELLSDLGLIDLLLSSDAVETVHLHLKAQPFFVSDAMAKDVQASCQALRAADVGSLQGLGERLESHMAGQRLVLQAHPFWTTWLHFPELPADLSGILAQSNLIILKGDANYRRLVEDRHWPFDTPLEAIAAYMPAPFVTLRTLKSEVAVGLSRHLTMRLAEEDPDWLINGRRGLIHFVDPT
jgi:uncharacterized protein with ATP-grasp and redox domains